MEAGGLGAQRSLRRRPPHLEAMGEELVAGTFRAAAASSHVLKA